MLTIRLSRIGKRKKPMYRLIVSEKSKDPYGRALEILGSYNPFTKELLAKGDRINHWLDNGSGISPTCNNLLVENGIIKRDKVVASKKGKKKEEEKKEAPKAEEKKEEVAEETKEDKVNAEGREDGLGQKAEETKEEKPAEEKKE